LLAVAATLLALGACEVVVRIVGIAPTVIPIGIVKEDLVYQRSKNPVLSYELKPNYRNDHANAIDDFPTTNSHGLRDVERSLEKPPGLKRVILLGDSVVVGHGVKNLDELMSRQLERLYPDGDVEVLNMAVSGYCTRSEVELLRQRGLQFDPDLVIVVFVENDFTNFQEETNYIDGIYDRPEIVKRLFRAVHLFRLACLKLNLFGYGQEADPVYWNRRALGDNNVVDGLSMLRQLAEEHGFEVIITPFPLFTDTEILYTDAMRMPDRPDDLIVERLARTHGLQTVRLLDGFQNDWQSLSPPPNPRRYYTIGDEMHPSAAGHRVAAEVLREVIDEQRLLESSSPPRTLLPQTSEQDEVALSVARIQGSEQPNYAAVHFNYGLALVNQQKYDEAIHEFEEAIRLDPEKAGDAHYGIGMAVRERGGPPEQVAERFAKAVELEPKNFSFRTHFADILQRMGKNAEAIQQFEQALVIDDDSAAVNFRLGNLLSGADAHERAIVHFERALELRPDFPEARNNLGAMLSALGRYGEAIPHFEQIMLVDEHSAIAHINLAEAYANVGRSSEALKVAREAQQLAETSGDKQLIEQVEKMLRSIESMAGAKP
jgi:tetratricopeptide (TPR) repeat protein